MSDNIRLLEDRVQRAVARLRQLSDERTRLAREVQELQQALQARGRDGEAEGLPEQGADGWEQERRALLGALREAVADLRGD